MSDNDVFVEALADAIGRPVEVSPVLEATTLGAGLLAGLAIGTYASTDELAATFSPRRTVEPRTDDADAGPPAASAGWRPGPRPRRRSPSSRASPSEAIATLDGAAVAIRLPVAEVRRSVRPLRRRRAAGARRAGTAARRSIVRGRTRPCIVTLAEAFGVGRAAVTLCLSGGRARRKVVRGRPTA